MSDHAYEFDDVGVITLATKGPLSVRFDAGKLRQITYKNRPFILNDIDVRQTIKIHTGTLVVQFYEKNGTRNSIKSIRFNDRKHMHLLEFTEDMKPIN